MSGPRQPELLALAAALAVLLVVTVRAARRDRVRDRELGIANRAGVEAALARLLRQGPATVVVLVPERFHELIAAIGRARSDALLQALTARMIVACGGHGTVGRIAPSCFAIALPGAGDAVDRRVAAIRAALDAPLIVDGVPYPVHATAGVASGPDDGDDAGRLLDCAEIALHAGQGTQRRFHAGIEQTARRRLAVLADLERALSTGQLHLHFQPIVDIATAKVDAVEALVRWDHPVHGTMPPATFIPLAEQTELIAPLTEHVLELALDHCAAWREDGLGLRVAVNLSARNVADSSLPGRVGEMLAARRLDGDALKLEITESVLMEQPRGAFETLAALRELGVAVALDDFGTGYSSLAYLKDLPLDEVKIDRAFVRVLQESPRSVAVLRTIVALAEELELQTVAEGIEDRETLALVAGLGCTMAQGFHFTRALAPTALRGWLERRAAAPETLFTADRFTRRGLRAVDGRG